MMLGLLKWVSICVFFRKLCWVVVNIFVFWLSGGIMFRLCWVDLFMNSFLMVICIFSWVLWVL